MRKIFSFIFAIVILIQGAGCEADSITAPEIEESGIEILTENYEESVRNLVGRDLVATIFFCSPGSESVGIRTFPSDTRLAVQSFNTTYLPDNEAFCGSKRFGQFTITVKGTDAVKGTVDVEISTASPRATKVLTFNFEAIWP